MEKSLEALYPKNNTVINIGSRLVRLTHGNCGVESITYMIVAIDREFAILINPITGMFWTDKNKVAYNTRIPFTREQLLALVNANDLTNWELPKKEYINE